MLIRFCTFCGEKILDEKRVRHRSPYCSEACRRDARNDLRAALRRDRCPSCGRIARPKSKPVEDFSGVLAAAQGNLLLETNTSSLPISKENTP